MIPNFAYVRAGSIQEAIEQLDGPEAAIHAGGTDLLGCLRDVDVPVSKVVSISGIPGLRGISGDADEGWRIGALTTIDEIATDPDIARHYPALARAAAEVASPQLRNQGTLGGNLCQRPRCWYFRGDFDCLKKGGDTCFAVDGENQFHCIFGGGPCHIVFPSDTAPALAAYGARLRIVGARGERELSVEEFYRLPDEDVERETVLEMGDIVTEVRLPRPDPRTRSSYRKVRARRVWDFALASAAIAVTMQGTVVEDARIVLGGVAPIPWRSFPAEAALRGGPLNAATIEAAAVAAIEEARPMGENAYKVRLVRGILEEELEALRRA